jgi:hypothetical protein
LVVDFRDFFTRHIVRVIAFSFLMLEIAGHPIIACIFLASPEIRRGDVVTWGDLWKVVVIDTNRHMLETFKCGLGIKPNNLEIDNLGRVGDYHANIGPRQAVVL